MEKQRLHWRIYRSLLITESNLPRAYGLPKIHKQNHPLRIIVSCIDSLLFPLASYLHNIIYNSIPKYFSYIQNSFHLVNKLNGFCLDEDYKLISLDVVSLFTNVPTELIGNSIVKRWNHISQNTKIPIDEFIMAISTLSLTRPHPPRRLVSLFPQSRPLPARTSPRLVGLVSSLRPPTHPVSSLSPSPTFTT